jgi:hypothetical protein
MKDERLPEKPTDLSLSIKMPRWTWSYALLVSRNRANTVLYSSNALLFHSLVLLDCLCIPCFAQMHIVFLRINDSFLATRMCTPVSFILTPCTHYAKDIGVTFVLSCLGIKNSIFFPVIWEHSCS